MTTFKWQKVLYLVAFVPITLAFPAVETIPLPLHGRDMDTQSVGEFTNPKTEGGACSSNEIEEIEKWIEFIVDKFVPAAIKALDAAAEEAKDKFGMASGFSAFNLLGVQYDFNAKKAVYRQEIDEVKVSFMDVKEFSKGDKFTYDELWMMCGDNYAKPKTFDDKAVDPSGEQTDVKIKDVEGFAQFAKPPPLPPYWIPGPNGYTFKPPGNLDPGSPGSRCKDGYAFHYFTESVADGSLKQGASDVITVCNRGHAGDKGLFSSEWNNKVEDMELKEGDPLASRRYSPLVLFHEMFHATKTATGQDQVDYVYTADGCIDAAQSPNDWDKARASPECSVLFALAAYLAQEDTNTDKNLVFWNGIGQTWEDAWKESFPDKESPF